jgi:hypothetical protein
MAAARREGFDEFYGAVFGRLVSQLVLVTGDLLAQLGGQQQEEVPSANG